MSFEEFGGKLSRLREAKGLSIDDVARRIKIPGRTLHDFETGEQSCTLHPVYCRGFVKAYAEFLEMDKDELEAGLNELYPPEEDDYPVPMLVRKPQRRGGAAGKMLLLAIIALVCAGVWYIQANGWPELTWLSRLTEATQPETPDPTPPPEVRPAPEEQPLTGQSTPPASPALPEDNGPISGDTSQPAGQISPLAASAQPGETVPEAGFAPPVQANSTLAAAGETASAKPHRLVIATSNQDCWTESKVDGEEKRQVYLKSGQTHILTFQEKLSLRLGNVSGVKLRLDGEPYELPAAAGSTRDLVFDFSSEAVP